MDLGNIGNSATMVGFGAIGAVFGGYTGMQMGIALAGYLFRPDEAKEHTPYNTNLKQTRSIVKPDVVPYLVGTDICPGMVAQLYRGPQIVDPDYYDHTLLNDFVENVIPEEMDWNLLDIGFITKFCDNAMAVNRVWFDNQHHWLWLRFCDYINKVYKGALYSIDQITRLEFWDSWLGASMDFDGAMVTPMSQNIMPENFGELEDDSKHYTVVGSMPKTFPDLKAEMTGGWYVKYTPYSGHAFTSVDEWRYHGDDYFHSFKDNKSHYTYGIFAQWDGAVCDIRRYNMYPFTYTRLADNEFAYNNITKGYIDKQTFSRQDISGNPDHLYFVQCRNWLNAGTYKHHHAEYSLAYDIFYIDRTDDTVHSVCYDERISVEGIDYDDSKAVPRIHIKSIEVTNNSVLLFGQEFQTHQIWSEKRTLTADDERIGHGKTRIFADFSQYPHDYWEDDSFGVHTWAYFYKHPLGIDKNERYRVTEQRNDYIEVEGNYALHHEAGDTVYITRIRKYQAGWSIVGEGSTKDKIICNYPTPFDPKISSLPYDGVQFENWQPTPGLSDWLEIDYVDGTEVHLKNPLTNDPVPGEIIWFTHVFFTDGIAYPDDKDFYIDFYNPTNYWFMDNLVSLLCPDWLIWSSMETKKLICHDFFVYDRYDNHAMLNHDNYGKVVILRFDKTTGEYLGKLYEHNPFPARWMGMTFYYTNEYCNINTVSTDAEVACSFNVMQYNSAYSINLVIDKSNHNVRDSKMQGNPLASSHTSGRSFIGSLKVNAYSPSGGYQDRWFVLAVESQPLNDRTNNNGHYLLDLGTDGIFPDVATPLSPTESEEYSSLLNIDANSDNKIKWFRQGLATGPYYAYNADSYRDSTHLRMYDYDEKIFFTLTYNGNVLSDGSEFWCYMPPNEYNQNGFSWLVSSDGRPDNSTMGGRMSTSKYLMHTGGPAISNWVDYSIYRVIEALCKYEDVNMEFDERDYADEIINDVVIYKGKRHDIMEPRYQYSKVWTKKTKVYEALEDVLATCQAYTTGPIDDYFGDNCKVRFPKPDEPTQWYFGFHEDNFNATITSATYDRIYIDLSNYPDNYWRGDAGEITIGLNTYQFEIEEQFGQYITLVSAIDEFPQINSEIRLVKDNIAEGSFAYSKKPQYNRSNCMRVEFVNRLLDYKIDVAEANYEYKQEVVDKRIILRHYEMHGIKRGTQAARMAMRYLDYEQFVNWTCSFQTDVLGHYFIIGDIIGITHPVTGWIGKPFRIIRKEELPDFTTMIEMEEYVPSIYHDYSNPIYQGSGSGSTGINLPINDEPDPVRRLYAHYDPVNDRIYVAFSKPVDSWNLAGVNIYAKVYGIGNYVQMGTAVNAIASVIYSEYPGTSTPSDMEPTRTKYNEMNEVGYQYTEIPYDPLTMLGTFPASGYLWVNGELIYYHGIDTVNNKFVNCIRCIDVPEYQYASDAPDDGYNWTNPLITLADMSNAFYFKPDPSWVDLTAEASQTEGSEIEYHIPTISIKAVSINVTGGSSSMSYSSPFVRLQLRSPMGRPYSPTLLRYERDL